jgi:sulfoxide reductase heme-binding subunit YedZ
MSQPLRGIRILDAAWPLWALLALPGAYLTYRYAQGAVFYGEYLHSTGELAARLLIATLAVTPLKLLFPAAAWTQWLARRRRYLGVAAFGYAALHAIAYVQRRPDLAAIAADAADFAFSTGWLALLVMLALAATSNDAAVRRLRRGWKRLHRAVYAAVVLTFAHWILSAFDPVPAFVHLAILVLLEAIRLWKTHVPRLRT